MYLPRAELVMWRGQLYCQYCLMDLRDEEARKTHASKPLHTPHKDYFKKSYSKSYIKNEYCERCGTTLYTVYIVNGRKLCKLCADEVLGDLRGSGLRMRPIRYKIRNKPLIISVFELIKGLLFRFIKKGEKKTKENKEKNK